MIRLSEQTPLGTGRHRKCYAHPEDAQRCIKIVYHRGDGGDKEIRRELKYYAHLGRRLKDWSGIPRYHGTVETDCGTGYVYDVIADFDGKPSITLTEFAASPSPQKPYLYSYRWQTGLIAPVPHSPDQYRKHKYLTRRSSINTRAMR